MIRPPRPTSTSRVLHTRRARAGATLIVAATLFGAACSDDSADIDAGAPNTTSGDTDTTSAALGYATCPETAPGPVSNESEGDAVSAEIEARGKPSITVPDAPATELCIVDDIVGAGVEVAAGGTVTVHYVGVGQASGAEFDSSWSRGETISFGLNQVIAGWGQGLVGMKVGGRRTLIIPAELAYGQNPPTPAIAPGETLVFVVDLVSTP